MYVTATTIIELAALIAALGAIGGVVVAVYKAVDMNKKQSVIIKEIQDEQTLICYGLKGALEGLIEQGCNGPCKDALAALEKHLNKKAHQPDL